MTSTHPIGLAAMNRVTRERFRRHCRPIPRLTMSRWAERYRVLSPEATAQHGPWQNEVVPYLADIMDTISDRETQEVVLVSPSQAGKSEALLNAIGYFVHQEPSSILVVQPTTETGESFSKDRVAPMLRDAPALRPLVAPARSRDSNNTILSKALALDTPVPTPDGWSTVGQLRVGDLVFGQDGQPCRVAGKSDVFTDHSCFRVAFSDGEVIIADGGHLWAVEWWQVVKAPGEKARNVRHQGVLRTEDMASRVRQGNRYRFSVRNAQPLDLPSVTLPIDPYVLGVWLGDGNSNGTRITAHAMDVDEMAGHVTACGHSAVKRFNKKDTYSFVIDPATPQKCQKSGRIIASDHGLRAALSRLGLLKKSGEPTRKHIPELYLRASISQRLSLLQGLMDTDGCIAKDGRSCTFVTTIPSLWGSFSELLASLGIKHKGSVRRCHATVNGRRMQGADAMQFSFASPTDMPIFRLRRKLTRQRMGGAPVIRTLYRRIVAIEPVQSVPVQCITVENGTHLFLAGRSMVPTHNSYPGGQLDIVGANAPSGLAMRPKRVVLLDERDRHPRSAGTEGDVKAIARARTRSFGRRRKIVEVSSPTSLEESLIWPSYLEGTQEVYEIPCPLCGHWQVPEFEQLKWEVDDAGRVVPPSVVLRCAGCAQGIPARERGGMLRAGRWRATAEPRVPYKRTFHLTGLVAAFGSWEELAQEFVTANGQADQALRAEMLRAFFNTSLGLLYRDQSTETVKSALVARAAPYCADGSWQVPQQVGLLTAGVDVQHDRAEIVVRGWGVGEESWLIARVVLRGDAFQPSFWTQLEEWRTRKQWRHESGATLSVRSLCIDAGDGAVAKSVYEYAAPRLGAGVFAVKGHGSPTAPMTPTKPTRVKPGRLYLLGVHAIMERLYRRLGMTAPGPGYLHLNEYAGEHPPDGVPADYVEQLTSMERKRDEKTRRYRYVARKGVRNEVADAEVYAYAALLLGPVPRDLLAQEVARVNALGAAGRERPAKAAPAAELPTAPTPKKTSGWLPSRGRGWR